MDGERFDELARLLAGGRNRRGVLRGAVGVVAAFAAGEAAAARRRRRRNRPGVPPPDPELPGDGAEDGALDVSRVGRPCAADGDCGRRERCANGECACEQEYDECDGRCVRTSVDPDNCGRCDKRCGPRETCCYGKCVDTETDALNCGRCGKVCEINECKGGECRPSRDRAWQYCDRQWVNTCGNEDHCGGCGNQCRRGEFFGDLIRKCCGRECISPLDWVTWKNCRDICR